MQHVAQAIRRDLEVPDGWRLHPGERAGERQPVQVVLPRNRRPVRALVPAPDVALEVDAPRLAIARRKAQGAERDGELGGPANLGDAGPHVPCAVPVQIEAAAGSGLLPLSAAEAAAALPLVGHLAVVLDARRVGAEHEAAQPVAIGIEDDLKAVGVVERGVAPCIRDDDPVGRFVVADHADIQRVGREHDADFGLLRGGLPFVGLFLPEGRHRRRLLPRRIAEDLAIEDRGLLHAHGNDRRRRARARFRLLPDVLRVRDAAHNTTHSAVGDFDRRFKRFKGSRGSEVQVQGFSCSGVRVQRF